MTSSAIPAMTTPRRVARAVSAAAIPLAFLVPSGGAAAAPVDDGPGVPGLSAVGVPPVGTLPLPEPPAIPAVPAFDHPPLPPDWPDDLTAPTLPPDDCNEYDADHFSVAVGRYDDESIEVQLAYTDIDVCDFTVWTSYWNTDDLGAGAASSSTVGMETVASATDSAGYHQLTIDDEDFCNWEVRVAVEEGLAEHYPGAEDCDPDDSTGDDPVDQGDDPGDQGGDPGDQGGDPGDQGDGAGEVVEQRLTGGDESGTRGPGLPRTGTDGTRILLGLGLTTLGFGSIVALLTRRRDEVPAL